MHTEPDHPQDFADRSGTAVVIGGTGGLGAAVCQMLADRGSRVAFTFQTNQDRATEIEEALGPETYGMAVDLTNEAAAAGFIHGVAKRVPIHTLVYAAGPTVSQRHISQIAPALYARHLTMEAGSFFNVVQPALQHLRKTGGAIVAITTAATRRYPVRDGLSPGTKAAVEAIVKGIAAEEGRFGIRANCVGPGMLTDGMAARLMASGDLDERALEITRNNIPLRAFGSAQDIAEAVCFLASDRAGFISGQCLDVDGGYTV